jgi:predicted transcriptional regulator
MNAPVPPKGEEHGRPSPAGESVRIVLSDGQVEEVLRGLAGVHGGGLHGFLLTHAGHLGQLSDAEEERWSDSKLSRSVLRGLHILRYLSLKDNGQSLFAIARGVQGTPSTTRRYLATLKQVGLVEQSEPSRKYRLAYTPERTDHGGASAAAEHVKVVLSREQVEQVLHGVKEARGSELHGFLLARTGHLKKLESHAREDELPDDRGVSRSLLRALMILRFLFTEASDQQIYDISIGVRLSHSTTHRYLATLKHVGLVEQSKSRKYRLPKGEQP